MDDPALDHRARMSRPTRRSRRTGVTAIGAVRYAPAVVLVIAPHLLGGVPGWTTVLLAFACCLLAVATWLGVDRASNARICQIEPLALALGCMLLITVLHALPLPAAVTSLLSPDSVFNARETAAALGIPAPTRVPFSLDPGGTQERILYGVAVCAMFAASRLLCAARRGMSIFVGSAVSVLVLALSSLCHLGLQAESVYSLYHPRFVTGPVLGPLLNPNNLAGFLALGLPIMIGLGMRERGSAAQRLGWLMAAAVTLATAVLSDSRSGIAACVFGALLFGGVLLLRRERGSERKNARTLRMLLVCAVVVVGIGLAYWASEDLLHRDYGSLAKLELLAAEVEVIRNSVLSHPLGVGRGAFSAAFAHAYASRGRAMHAESFPLQYIAEFGPVLAVALMAVAVVSLVRAFANWRSTVRLGGAVGVLAISLQNLLDFSLELTGIAVVYAACFAASLPFRRGDQRPSSASVLRSLRLPAWFDMRTFSLAVALLGFVLVAMLGKNVSAHELLALEGRLESTLNRGDHEAFQSMFAEAAPYHPAQASLALLAAVDAVRSDDARAPIWLNRAMWLAPKWAAPHAIAVHWLASKGRWEQAVAELHEAAKGDPAASRQAMCALARIRPSADVVLSAIPERGAARTTLLDAGVGCLTAAPEEANKVNAVLLREEPRHVQAQVREVQRLLSERDWPSAQKHARRVQALEPSYAIGYTLEAEALLQARKPAEAIRSINRVLPRLADPSSALTALGRAQALAARLAEAKIMLAKRESSSGRYADALLAYREAYELRPDPSSLATAASLAEKLGDTRFAQQARKKLCELEPENPSYCQP